MDLHDLLEAVEADEDERVVQLSRGRLLQRHLVDEEAVQRQWLLVDHVLHGGLGDGGGTTRAPALGQCGFLNERERRCV